MTFHRNHNYYHMIMLIVMSILFATVDMLLYFSNFKKGDLNLVVCFYLFVTRSLHHLWTDFDKKNLNGVISVVAPFTLEKVFPSRWQIGGWTRFIVFHPVSLYVLLSSFEIVFFNNIFVIAPCVTDRLRKYRYTDSIKQA